MARFRNAYWNLRTVDGDPNTAATDNDVIQALLMDLRDELQKLNGLLSCANFLRIPRTLRGIERQIKMQRRCPVHPRYTGARPPRVDCRACRRFYKAVWK